MGSKWETEKFTGSNDFELWKVNVREILTQQKCDEAYEEGYESAGALIVTSLEP